MGTTTSRFRGAALAVAAGIGIGVFMALLGVLTLARYGAVLFLLTPLAMGLTSALVLHLQTESNYLLTLRVVICSLLGASFLLLLFGWEGIICVLMAVPLGLPMALAGAAIGTRLAEVRARPTSLMLGLLLLPAAAGVETMRPPDRSTREVYSFIEINAPPEEVWMHVLTFPPLEEPTEWWSKAGLAYPMYASIDGAGVGAVRYCVFSTGPFVETITAWEPAQRLAFDVVSSPAPLRELSLYEHVHPPQLDGYLRPRRGEFLLIALRDGRTRLEGRTWYELDMAPAWYWEAIVDGVIHRIHGRVLEHIKQHAESST